MIEVTLIRLIENGEITVQKNKENFNIVRQSDIDVCLNHFKKMDTRRIGYVNYAIGFSGNMSIEDKTYVKV